MRASTMLEHEEKYAVILAFDVKVRGQCCGTGTELITVLEPELDIKLCI